MGKIRLEEQETIEGESPECSWVCGGLGLRGGAALWALWLGRTSLTLSFASSVCEGEAGPVQIRGTEP